MSVMWTVNCEQVTNAIVLLQSRCGLTWWLDCGNQIQDPRFAQTFPLLPHHYGPVCPFNPQAQVREMA